MTIKNLRSIVHKIRYELSIFALLIVQFIPQAQDFSDDAYASTYALDYWSVGFAPRILVGSVLSVFIDFRGRLQLNIFFTIGFLLAIALVAVLGGHIIRTADSDMKRTVIFFAVLFLVGPYTNSFLFPRAFSPDRFLAIFTVLCFVIANKPRVRWLFPVFIFFALATHHMFTFMYMPALAILVFYEFQNKSFRKTEIPFFAINAVVMVAGTAFFYLFSGLKRLSFEEVLTLAASKTDIPLREDMFEGYFFLDAQNFSEQLFSLAFSKDSVLGEIRATVFLLPLIALLVYLWMRAIRLSESRSEKFVYALILFALPVARLPLFFTTTEVYRGRVALLIVHFLFIFYFLYFRNPHVTTAAKEISAYFFRYPMVMIFYIGYFGMAFSAYYFENFWIGLIRSMIGSA